MQNCWVSLVQVLYVLLLYIVNWLILSLEVYFVLFCVQFLQDGLFWTDVNLLKLHCLIFLPSRHSFSSDSITTQPHHCTTLQETQDGCTSAAQVSHIHLCRIFAPLFQTPWGLWMDYRCWLFSFDDSSTASAFRE